MRFRSNLARNVARRVRFLLDGKDRLSCLAIEDKCIPRFCRLRHSVNRLALPMHSHQRRRRIQIAIPDVMMNRLIVPHKLSGVRVKGDERIAVEVVTNTVSAIEIRGRRAEWNKDHPTLRINRQSTPVICGASIFICILWPRFIPWLARMRNGMKLPADLPCVHIESAYVSRERRQLFGHPTTADQ